MLVLLAVALAAERVETASVDGTPVVLRIDDATATLGVRKQPPSGTQRDWTGATVLSAGMRRWWTLRAVRDKAVRDLLGRDAAGWVERTLARCPEDSPAHLWLATAASLGGTSLDRLPDAEQASQQAARFRQQREALPFGVYALDELRHLAALDAWLARPMPAEVRGALDPLLTGPSRTELAAMQRVTAELFGKGDPLALVPRGNGDPLVALLDRDLKEPERTAVERPGPVTVRPQEVAEPCSRCTHLGPPDPASWAREPAFSGAPVLLVPVDYDDRNRPVLQGFVGVQTRNAELFYASPPAVRDAEGAPFPAALDTQRVTLHEPRPVRVVLDRAPTQAELETRFTSTLDVDEALADLRPPPPPSGCRCSTARPLATPWWTRVRRRASTE